MSLDLERVVAAIGAVPRVSYEAAHVYPLSAPNFVSRPRASRERPAAGPLKLYVHVPFCNYACTFCFYAKRVGAPRAAMERYVAALVRELEWVEPGTPLAQLYVGGGTPTALPADLLDAVLEAVLGRMPPEPGASLTVECSPESVSDAHLDVLAQRRVNRASLGIESLDPGLLDLIHRRHGAAQALDACRRLIARGLFVNVDLMYGFPGQSEARFADELRAAAACDPASVSLYNLRLNERTPLERVTSDLERLDLEQLVRWRALAHRIMAELGYEQVRWHTFVKADRQRSSFDRAPCVDGFAAGRQLGIGVSAVSHLGYTIYRNHDGFDAYLERIEAGESPTEEVFALDGEEDRRTLFVARTLGDGRPLERGAYAEAFARTPEEDFPDVLERLRAAGLVDEDGDALCLSADGKLAYDLVTLAFYPAAAKRWLAARQAPPAAARAAAR